MRELDIIERAKGFAVEAHGGQKYGDMPYIVHLAHVEEVLTRFGVKNETFIAAAWLHDVVEDTSVTVEEIQAMFGEEVADIIARVTSEPGVNRKERNAKTYPKIAANFMATILKFGG
jgi:(p)ppGpp synthase/HD superfamily hydrolase